MFLAIIENKDGRVLRCYPDMKMKITRWRQKVLGAVMLFELVENGWHCRKDKRSETNPYIGRDAVNKIFTEKSILRFVITECKFIGAVQEEINNES